MTLHFFSKHNFTEKATKSLTVQKLDGKAKNGSVYNLHAGWFINRPPEEFVNWGLFIKFKVFSVEILQKEGKV